jgi:phosphoglycerate dehydrogenase-like enzyme
VRDRTLTVVVADGIGPAPMALLDSLQERLGVRLVPLEADEPGRGLTSEADLLLVKRQRVGRRELARMPGLRGVQKLGIVTDNLDERWLSEAGIKVRTLVLPSSVTVADHTMALLLAAARNLRAGMRAMSRTWDRRPVRTSERDTAFNWAQLPSLALLGRQLGLVGFGEIGAQVAIRARAFGLRTAYTKRQPLPDRLERRFGVRYQDLETLLRESDIVSLHAPHTPETERMLDRRRISWMKPGAILVNTARGALIDEEALVDAVRGGSIAGLGLDVYSVEPLPADSPLLGLEPAVLTPHLAGAGPEALVSSLAAALRRWRRDLRRATVSHLQGGAR